MTHVIRDGLALKRRGKVLAGGSFDLGNGRGDHVAELISDTWEGRSEGGWRELVEPVSDIQKKKEKKRTRLKMMIYRNEVSDDKPIRRSDGMTSSRLRY